MDFDDLKKAIVDGDADKTAETVEKMLNGGVNPKKIIDEGIVPAMSVVGQKFDDAEIFIPEMLISADAAQAALDKIEPLLVKKEIEEEKKAVFATVKGDQHDIGKNLTCMVFKGAGWRVKDLGIDVPPEKIIEAVKEVEPDVLGLSTLLTTTMGEQENIIKELKKAGLRDKVKVIVGGAPVTQDFAKEIGADMYGESPFDALKKLKGLV